jgi:hypothetical protein
MLTENDVVDAVPKHLANDGWVVRQTRTTSQTGIDILAEKNAESLAIEAKGGGSARVGSARYGKEFTANQKRTHVAVALLTAAQVLSDGKHRAALALPEDTEHSRLIARILPTLRKLGIQVYFVRDDRTVHFSEAA